MYKIIDYSTKKVIRDGFKTIEEVRRYERQYHKNAFKDNIKVHNWLTLIIFDNE